jgi:serine/threonine protein phosphatase PrpC
MTNFRAAWITNIGNVRKENEDRIVFDEAARLFGVADGVGGLPGGSEAAQKTADVVTAGVVEAGPESEVDLRAIVTAANEAVAALGQRISPSSGIGSTLTIGCLRHGRMKIAHVGDSRAFSWRRGEISCLTEDHTVENEARRRRARGEVVYYSEAQRGALTRCIGQTVPPDIDLADLPVQADDRFIFCTDGVTRLVFEREIRDLVGRFNDPAEIARTLVEMALQRGGPDNATVAIVIVDQP